MGRLASKAQYAYSVLFIFTAPFMLLWQALRSRDASFTRWALTLLITICGSTIDFKFSNDGYRHRQMVIDVYTQMSLEQFVKEIFQMFTFTATQSGATDLYKHALSYLVGSVLGLPGLFFTFVAFVYGYFFSGAMIAVFRNFRGAKKGWIFWGFAILFLLLKNVEGINTVRTWTGLWILFYGTIRYYETKRFKYVLLMLCTPLIHLGYFIMALPVLAVLVLGNRPLIYAALFVLSSFTNFINPTSITQEIAQTELGASKVRGYYVEEQTNTNERLSAQAGTSNRWYRQFQKAGIQRWALNILVYGLLLYRIYPRNMNSVENKLFATGLVTLTLSNSTWFLFALSARLGLIGMVFVLAAFVMLMQRQGFRQLIWKRNIGLRAVTTLSLLTFIPYILWNLSALLEFISIFVFFLPFVNWWDSSISISLKEVLRLIFPF